MDARAALLRRAFPARQTRAAAVRPPMATAARARRSEIRAVLKAVHRPFFMARLKVPKPGLAPWRARGEEPVRSPVFVGARPQAPPPAALSLLVARPALGRSPPR